MLSVLAYKPAPMAINGSLPVTVWLQVAGELVVAALSVSVSKAIANLIKGFCGWNVPNPAGASWKLSTLIEIHSLPKKLRTIVSA